MNTHAVRIVTRFAAVAVIASGHSGRGDVVTDWNDAYLQAIRVTGGPPCPIARAGAIVHVAMYDAINSIERTHEPYHIFEEASPTASKEAALAMAAHTALSSIYEGNAPLQDLFDDLLQTHLDAIPDGPDKVAGLNLGVSCATGMLKLRQDDGWDEPITYVPGPNPGDWQPTFPDFTFPPASPHWPAVAPWTLTSGNQFRPVGPAGYTGMAALLASPEYAATLNDVKELGAIDSTTRTAEQTEIARFWANDRNGTYKPPGHLNLIAQVVGAQQGNTLSENARLFALINIAMADAGVVAWDAKYATDIDLWRPITGIREADTDDNPATEADPDWEPLSNDPAVNGFTPPFPAWVSGHATFGAVHAAILEGFYRTDDIVFTVGSDDTPGVMRTFQSFTEAALENGRSRIYLGVHWQLDADDGFTSGQALGQHIIERYLRRLGDTNGDCDVDLIDLVGVIDAWDEADSQFDIAPPGGDGSVNVDDLLAVITYWGSCP